MQKKYRRKKTLVDREVQSVVVKRVLFYWLYCVFFLILSLALVQTLIDPKLLLFERCVSVVVDYWPMFVALTAMLPFVVYDVLKLSHRFAGPIYRTRGELGHCSSGTFQNIKFRKGDFWHDLTQQINYLVERVESAEKRNTHDEQTVEI